MANSVKRERRSLTGVLLLDKDLGLSSNAALTKLKYLFNAQKAGHTGTLDPFASGLLPVCFGEASKFASYMLDADKTYEATIRLGRVTSTADREGEILQENSVQVSQEDIMATLPKFLGNLKQMPPMHSALKHQGQPLYLLARQGIEIKREARDITILQIEMLDFSSPFLKLIVKCTKGTYIRVLAEDIGKALGCGGMLEDLRRTATGGFQINEAFNIADLSTMELPARDLCLIGPDSLLSHIPQIDLEEICATNLIMGKVCRNTSDAHPGVYRAYSKGSNTFLGLVEHLDDIVQAKRMMSSTFVNQE